MIIYEVSITLNAEIADDYIVWLEPHIDRMRMLGLFKSASLFKVVEPQDKIQYVVHYQAESMREIERYLNEHAAVMRSEIPSIFLDKVEITRKILASPHKL